jgi:uncharacterized RDD family membrane protein YckC
MNGFATSSTNGPAAPNAAAAALPIPAAAAPMPIFHDHREDFTVYPAAGFVLRWYALTLDLAFSAPLNVLVKLPFSRYLERLEAYGHRRESLLVATLLTAIPFVLYFLAPTALWGVTLGKKIVGLRVVAAGDRGGLGFEQALMRETIGRLLTLATLGAGYLMVAWTPSRRALHDHLAGTRVVSLRAADPDGLALGRPLR